MNVLANIAKVGLLLAGLVAMPAWAQQTASEARDLAQYQRYAQAPVESVHYFRIEGFEYLAPDKLAVWFGVNKMYLLTVQTPCNNLAYANGIGLTSRNNTLYRKFDFVTFRHQRCEILKIQPVNELKMKQGADKTKKSSAPVSGG